MDESSVNEPNTLQFEVDEDDLEASSPPEGIDLLRTVEMDRVSFSTRPMPSLDATTRPHSVPSEVLALARTTMEQAKPDALEFRAVMDPDGAITVPESLRARVRGPIRVMIILDEN